MQPLTNATRASSYLSLPALAPLTCRVSASCRLLQSQHGCCTSRPHVSTNYRNEGREGHLGIGLSAHEEVLISSLLHLIDQNCVKGYHVRQENEKKNEYFELVILPPKPKKQKQNNVLSIKRKKIEIRQAISSVYHNPLPNTVLNLQNHSTQEMNQSNDQKHMIWEGCVFF